jgi:hypothetical protein
MNKLKALWAKVKMPLWIGWKVFIGITCILAAFSAVKSNNTPLAILVSLVFVVEIILPVHRKPSIEMNTYNYFNIDETLAKAFKEQAAANCPDKVEPKE